MTLFENVEIWNWQFGSLNHQNCGRAVCSEIRTIVVIASIEAGDKSFEGAILIDRLGAIAVVIVAWRHRGSFSGDIPGSNRLQLQLQRARRQSANDALALLRESVYHFRLQNGIVSNVNTAAYPSDALLVRYSVDKPLSS